MFRQVFFLGPPGVGKGTYAKRVSPRIKFSHISPGDLLRRVASEDPEIESLLRTGQLVPQEKVFALMSREMDTQRRKSKGVILDGFPRNLDQAKSWFSPTDDSRPPPAVPDLVIEFSLPDDLLIKKLLGRRVCGSCGDLYNVFSFKDGHYSMPAMLPIMDGICDKCGDRLIKRTDDTYDTIERRLRFHRSVEKQLIEFLDSRTSVIKFPVKTGIAQLDDLVHVISHTLDRF